MTKWETEKRIADDEIKLLGLWVDANNRIYAGAEFVTMQDKDNVELQDFSSSFIVIDAHLGKNKVPDLYSEVSGI